MKDIDELLSIDRDSIWHPYSAMSSELPLYHVESASGVRLKLSNGRELIDGMSSWWCAIHGYNHPQLNRALKRQLSSMAHVMFGGLTHSPAIRLTQKLLSISPEPLTSVFYSDSGSVSVEVAMKMALQYWYAKGQVQRKKFISLKSGYHGDTFAAMSVCDPVTGMHGLFHGFLPEQIFVDRPQSRFGETSGERDIASLKRALNQFGEHVAALILEPVVQGAGGMWFYSADYLKRARRLCDEYDVLLIFDEIATGFGRTGKLFALEHADVIPDILCIGKALTGGYLSLAATLTTTDVQQTLDNGTPGVFMHGPTFMANPLACSVSLSSINLLLASDWQDNIRRIESRLQQGLAPCKALAGVVDVRVLGGIGVVEMKQPVDVKTIVPRFVAAGVWVRPFNRLVYLMPPYIINNQDIDVLTGTLVSVLAGIDRD